MGNNTQAKLPEYAATIKALRLHLGESQESFGRRFGVTKQAVNNWEKGRTEPTAAVLIWVLKHD